MLRAGGANILTTQEAGNCGKDDGFQVAFAARTRRVMVTRNRRHFLNNRLVPPETTPGVLAIDVVGRSEDAELAATAIITGFIVPYGELFERMNMRVSASRCSFHFIGRTGRRRTVSLSLDDLVNGRYPTEDEQR
jgi:hypothetical protein